MSGINFRWSTGSCLGGPLNKSNCEVQPRFKDSVNEDAMDRKVSREAFGNYFIIDSSVATVQAQLLGPSAGCAVGAPVGPGILTPFRRAMNAGDPYGKVNMPPSSSLLQKPANQVNAPRAGLHGWQTLAGSGTRTVNGGSAYSGNPKYVYDGADYVRFKRLKAKNNNYNDPTFGGDQHNASQVALSHARRGIH